MGSAAFDVYPAGVVVGVQQQPRQFAVVVVEVAIEGGVESRTFGLHPAASQPGEDRRIPLFGERLDHGAPGHTHDVGGHRRQLDQSQLAPG